MHDEPRLEEQALSKLAEAGITSQVDEAEKIEVDVQTDLLKMVQGQADGVDLKGQGIVMQKDIRVQEMELHTDDIAINPLSALFGQIELNEPINATARLVLTEEDLNRALSSEYVLSKMQKIELNVEGKTAVIEPQRLKLQLPAEGKIVFRAHTTLHSEVGTTKEITFTAAILVNAADQPLLIEGFACTPGQGISLEFAIALMKKLRELLSSPYFDLQGMTLNVKNVEVQKGSITLISEAYVRQLPSI